MAETEKKTAKYRFLVDTIKNKIKSGGYMPGERMESENELSAQFGYSRQTVRQALGVLEQEGLIERRRGSGTYISEAGRRPQRGNNVAIVTTYISDYIFPTIIRGIEETLTGAGYSLTLGVTNNHVEDESRILQSLIERGVDGVIVEGTKTAFPNPNVELYRRLEKMGVPVVFFNSYYRDLPHAVYVVTDDRGAGLKAVDLLAAKGCRKIGGVFKSDDMQGHGRYAGFSEGLIRNGCPLSDENVVWYTTAERSRLFREDNRDYMFERLRGCDGIVCYNDQIAYGVIELLTSRGVRVPEDVLVTGFDNSSVSEYSPVKITSFEHPKDEMGRIAANKLINMLRDGETEYPLVLDMPLHEKQSTKK
ncbi:MAG: GntR family transcriptional regulator [Clostridia bacterium]|nr:GntR family transcriptional regulator [Clostridia bacterium]